MKDILGSVLSDLSLQPSNVSDLPCLGDLAVTQVGDHGLVNLEAPSRCVDPSEARLHGACDDDPSHLHVTVDDNLLTSWQMSGMAASASTQTAFSSSAVLVDNRAERNDRVRVEEIIEGVKIARVPSSEPAKHDGFAAINHETESPMSATS